MKLITILGVRPDIIRLNIIIKKLDQLFLKDHVLVNTGQNFDPKLNDIFIQELGVRKPDYHLGVRASNQFEQIGKMMVGLYEVFEKENPDYVLILGDTNTDVAAAITARHFRKNNQNGVPVFHMEAGNRCFDQRVPEETNRKIVDHTADINLTYSDIAREYLLREGLPADRVIKTGSPMFEVLNSRKDDIEKSDVLERLGLETEKYFVVSAHREENISSEQNFMDLVDSLNTIAEKYQMPLIVSTHPRTRKMIESKGIEFNPLVKTMKPLGFNDYVKLQKYAKAVLSDSGTISEESSILGFRALNIRQAHERPEAMEEASVMMVGLKKERILQGLEVLETQDKDTLRLVADYSMPNVSDKVLRILLSYTDYVTRVVWGE